MLMWCVYFSRHAVEQTDEAIALGEDRASMAKSLQLGLGLRGPSEVWHGVVIASRSLR